MNLATQMATSKPNLTLLKKSKRQKKTDIPMVTPLVTKMGIIMGLTTDMTVDWNKIKG